MNEKWNEKYKWCFSPLGTGDKVGVNNAGIGIFKKQPYIGLAKEILQNVIDAKDKNITEPAKAVFEVIYVPKTQLPDPERLSYVIKQCYEYYHEGDDGIKMGLLKSAAESLLDGDDLIPVLKISDFNTVGLTGAREEKGSNWTGLVREISATNKGNGKSGSFGVGKFAPFNFSQIRTIIYSTHNKDGETALQGKTILTTFRDEDGKLKQNVGLFGLIEEEDCKAIYDPNDAPDIFNRTECGTDLFVIGFKNEEEWMQQVAVSVLEYFFYTIYIGDLEVSIIDGGNRIDINKDSLSSMMNKYADYCHRKEIEFSAPAFWEILNDRTGRTKHYAEPFDNKGEVELYLLVDQDLAEKRILEMRTAGMKITEDTAFRIGAYFRGIFIATGKGSKSDNPKDNINSFLRKCENQAHDTWSKDEYENHTKEADAVIKKIHSWILEKVKAEIPEVDTEETEGYGLADLIPNQESDGKDDTEEKAYFTFEPLPVDITQSFSKKPQKKASDVSIISKNPDEKDPDDVVIPNEEGEEPVPAGGSEPTPNPPHPPYPGPFPGPFPGPEPTPNPNPFPGGDTTIPGSSQEIGKKDTGRTTLHGLRILGVRTPYDNTKGEFRITFIPEKTADDVHVRLRIGADDEDKRQADVNSAFYGETKLELSRGFILLPHVDKSKKVVLRIKLNNARRCQLEVSAYAK